MKGKYEVVVKSRRLQYKFTVFRNITILRGDSATGKTTLIDMIAAYQEMGKIFHRCADKENKRYLSEIR